MKQKILILLALLLPAMTFQAQEVLPRAWQQYLELLSENEEDEMVEELLELYETRRDCPANLNDTAQLLLDIPFVDDLQRECLKGYVALYGPLLSIEELYAINGFDSSTIELLRPLVAAQPVEATQKLTLKEILAHGRSNLVTGAGGTIEKARGYRDSIYEGNDLRLMWRYYFRWVL